MKHINLMRYQCTDESENNLWINVANSLKYNLSVMYKDVSRNVKPSFTSGSVTYTAIYSLAKLRVFTWFQGGEKGFWLIQHHKNLGIYFPNEKVYVSLYAHDNELHYIVIDELESLDFSIEKCSIFDDSSFGYSAIFYLSYARPYHYFYDTLPPFLEFLEMEAEKRKVSVLTFKSGAFYPVSCLENVIEKYFECHVEMNEWLFNNKIVTLKITKDGVDKYGAIKYDQLLIEKSKKIASENINNISIDQFDYVLWFGACAEKRSWLEWKEAFVLTVNAVRERFKNKRIVVLLDGMTAPAYVSREDYLATLTLELKDSFRELYSILNDIEVLYFDITGFNSHEKIKLAQKVDFFVSGFLTDSIYVSRFGKARGIGHGASISIPGQHINPHCHFLPRGFVEDIPGDNNWSKVSYSINPNSYIEAFKFFVLRYSPVSLYDPENNAVLSVCYSDAKTTVFDSIVSDVVYVLIGSSEIAGDIKSNGREFIKLEDNIEFRAEGRSLKGSRVFVIGYNQNVKCFSKGISFGTISTIKFPAEVSSFRIFVRLVGGDRVWINDVHWNGLKHVGSVCSAGSLKVNDNDFS